MTDQTTGSKNISYSVSRLHHIGYAGRNQSIWYESAARSSSAFIPIRIGCELRTL